MSINAETIKKRLKEKFRVDVSDEEIRDLISSSVQIIRQPVSINEINCSRASVVSGLSANSHSAAGNDTGTIQKESHDALLIPIEEVLDPIKDVLEREGFVLELEGDNSTLDEAAKHFDQENNFIETSSLAAHNDDDNDNGDNNDNDDINDDNNNNNKNNDNNCDNNKKCVRVCFSRKNISSSASCVTAGANSVSD